MKSFSSDLPNVSKEDFDRTLKESITAREISERTEESLNIMRESLIEQRLLIDKLVIVANKTETRSRWIFPAVWITLTLVAAGAGIIIGLIPF